MFFPMQALMTKQVVSPKQSIAQQSVASAPRAAPPGMFSLSPAQAPWRSGGPTMRPVQQPPMMAGGPMAPQQMGYAPPQQAPTGGGFAGMLRNAYSRLPQQAAQVPVQQPMQDNRARVMQAMMAQGGRR